PCHTLSSHPDLRDLHSFPTRRSSDLVTPHALAAFDPVEQTLVTGHRDDTTVSGQALFLLNSSFVCRQSLTLGEKLLAQKDDDTVDRKSTRLNSSHVSISYAVFCLKKK